MIPDHETFGFLAPVRLAEEVVFKVARGVVPLIVDCIPEVAALLNASIIVGLT